MLEETIEREVRTFAYPFGYESTAVRALVAQAGFASACRVNYSVSPAGEDVFGISRLPVVGDCSIEDFAALVDGRAVPSHSARPGLRLAADSRPRNPRRRRVSASAPGPRTASGAPVPRYPQCGPGGSPA